MIFAKCSILDALLRSGCYVFLCTFSLLLWTSKCRLKSDSGSFELRLVFRSLAWLPKKKKPLTIIPKHSTLDAAAALDPPL